MTRKQRGFLYYDVKRDSYGVDWLETLSILVGELLLEEILAARPYMQGRLLDIGCGKRPYALIYESLVEMSVGTEVASSPHGIAEADVICVAEALPFPDRSFDIVLCTEVLEHTRKPFQVMDEIARVLKPGGYLLLSVPFIYPVHEAPHDHWRFTVYGLEDISHTVGLVPLYVHPKGGPFVALISLGINIAVRSVNALSKLLGLARPGYEYRVVRWFLSLPQWVYLWAIRSMRMNRHTPWLKKAQSQIILKFSNAFRRTSWLYEINCWMTAGYFMVAQKPLEEPADRR